MIKVMIIDDDAMIRDYLRDVILWDELGLCLCCEAGDSETAWELFSLHHPKIIITDINIPIISGLELAKEFISIDKDIRFLVITGYDDFDYVRESVRLGAIDLLSKPIDPNEINSSLKKTVSHFTELQKHYRAEKALKTLLSDNRDLLQERSISQLLDLAPAQEEQQLIEHLRLLSLSFPEKYYCTVVIGFDTVVSTASGNADIPVIFKSKLEESLQKNGFTFFSYFSSKSNLVFLVNWSSDLGNNQLEDLLNRLMEEVEFYFQSSFLIGIGGTVEHLNLLYLSKQQALYSLRLCKDRGEKILNYRNVQRSMELIESSGIAKGKGFGLSAYSDAGEAGILLSQQPQVENRMILLAKKYIKEKYSDPDLSLDMVSSHIGLSKIYFCQLFHKEAGVGFTQYLNSVRIDESCRLLYKSNKKIYEISTAVGYRNPKYFNYVFKRIMGSTPAEYRNNEAGKTRLPEK